MLQRCLWHEARRAAALIPREDLLWHRPHIKPGYIPYLPSIVSRLENWTRDQARLSLWLLSADAGSVS